MKLTENLIKKLKSNNGIFLNGSPIRTIDTVSLNDKLEVIIDFNEKNDDIIPENINLDILYEDEGLIIINKPKNIVVHPSIRHQSNTIANALAYYYINNNINSKIRPVSRLDKDTTGVIIFAKNQHIQDAITKQMNTKQFTKEYIGIVHGIPSTVKGTINLPIARKEASIIERVVSPNGSASITHFELLKSCSNASLLKFNLETGRTHQIRVHCRAINLPLYGDTLYSDIKTDLIDRQALHSYRVEFINPISQLKMSFTAPYPDDIKKLMEILLINFP